MPFASINPTNPRTPENFTKILRIGGFENLSFFWSAILNFFFKKKMLHPHENQSKQGWFEILMITLISRQKSLTANIFGLSVCTSSRMPFMIYSKKLYGQNFAEYKLNFVNGAFRK